VLIAGIGCAALVAAFSRFTPHAIAQTRPNSCVSCHSSLPDERLAKPAMDFDQDIHKQRGLSCTDCHGGDAKQADKSAAKSSLTGYTGKPAPGQIPAFCGKCHSDANLMKRFDPSLRVDQVQEYFTSIHGKRLQGGDLNVATCVSCHGIHGIRAVDDPQSKVFAPNVAETCASCHSNAEKMGAYGIAHDQFVKYKASVHAAALYEKNDLSAPTCNDCHGNHGAVPPGLDTVANVCGQCHGRQAELFRQSPHKNPFDAMKRGECLQCHSNHEIKVPTDAMAGIGQESVCIACHQNDRGFAAAGSIAGGLDNLQASIRRAAEHLEQAERAGMEVSKPKFELKGATDALTQARVLVHTASAEQVGEAISPGVAIAEKAFLDGEAAFSELAFRRKGLVISLFFILFLAGLVFLKIRQIEGRYPFAA
jgi:predicted CXXCH cytochrome family protein